MPSFHEQSTLIVNGELEDNGCQHIVACQAHPALFEIGPMVAPSFSF